MYTWLNVIFMFQALLDVTFCYFLLLSVIFSYFLLLSVAFWQYYFVLLTCVFCLALFINLVVADFVVLICLAFESLDYIFSFYKVNLLFCVIHFHFYLSHSLRIILVACYTILWKYIAYIILLYTLLPFFKILWNYSMVKLYLCSSSSWHVSPSCFKIEGVFEFLDFGENSMAASQYVCRYTYATLYFCFDTDNLFLVTLAFVRS